MIPWEDLKLARSFRIVPRWGEKVRQLYPQLDQLLGAIWPGDGGHGFGLGSSFLPRHFFKRTGEWSLTAGITSCIRGAKFSVLSGVWEALGSTSSSSSGSHSFRIPVGSFPCGRLVRGWWVEWTISHYCSYSWGHKWYLLVPALLRILSTTLPFPSYLYLC